METKADVIERLRRRMSEIPARSLGASTPALASLVDERVVAAPEKSSSLRTLPVPGPLAALLPHRGLVRGSSVHIAGAASLQVGLIASVTGSGSWAAVVGSPRLGLLSVSEMGGDLSHCALIPEAEDPVAVAAVLADGLDLVVVSLGGANIPPRRARAVAARARRAGSVLAFVDGTWPTVDVHLDAHVAGFRGLDSPTRRITGVDLDVEVRARGHRPRRASVEVIGRSGAVTWRTRSVEPVRLRAAQ